MLGGTFGIIVMIGFMIMLAGILFTASALLPIMRSRDELQKNRLFGEVARRWRRAGMIALPVTVAPYVWLDYTLDKATLLAETRNAEQWELYGTAVAFVCLIFLISLAGEYYFQGKIKELEQGR